MLAQVDPQRQGVDKHPHGPFGAFTPLQTTEQHRAEHHLFAAADFAQHMGPGHMQQAGGTDTRLARLGTQALAQLRLNCPLSFFSGAQVFDLGGRVDLTQHLAKERLVIINPQAGLRDIVAIRHRRAQLGLLPQQKCLHFMLQDFQRKVVHH